MILTLRSLLWQHGAPAAITGTCATEQARQNSSAVGEIPALGGGYWAHFGERHWSSPRKKPVASSVPLSISRPAAVAISGYAETGQTAASSAGSGQQRFEGALNSSQLPSTAVSGRNLLAVAGATATEQFAVSHGEAAMVDVELELFAAMLLVA